ncbi:hypothetical protein BpHYR1_001618 [Brachionus plicatilis]|uniref:Uncharacterized protein n=1 Tax=Brachionus plicatilis TaxID=10195 RepID=A0A3M7Q9I4_BRAPC|nr:hypothetical protein BpHYR1_001618 [Brachionus plicatilis]
MQTSTTERLIKINLTSPETRGKTGYLIQIPLVKVKGLDQKPLFRNSVGTYMQNYGIRQYKQIQSKIRQVVCKQCKRVEVNTQDV